MNIYFVSLGCDKNLVDSEVMLGLLTKQGYTLTNDETKADIIVVNTCSFIHDAKQESVDTLLEMAEYKKSGQVKVLIAAGCLAQRYQQEILDEITEVDAVVGTTGYGDICQVIDKVLQGQRLLDIHSLGELPAPDVRRVITTGGYSSYLKIAEGCDKHCSYCIIPKIRGEYRSYPMEEVLKQAKDLARAGIKELNIVAQETTMYGKDLYGAKVFPELLRRLCQIDGIRWIRILYCYPEEITDELIQVIREEEKVCHYLDLPIQHANDEILKRMGRRTTRKDLENVIQKLRENIPDIALRTTLITGFPGETQQQHEELMDFVERMGFDRLGVFTYSPEEGTAAATMPDQIPEEEKLRRQDELMSLQQNIAFDISAAMVGRTLDVLVEGKLPEEGVYIGRTYKDAPDVDGYIFISAREELLSGSFVTVRVTASHEYDLIGEVIYESAK
ncbi:ribosomal protein S12 methylthiotransferase [Catenibacillus scindens]|uniref:Ribosomal protein uS12 methylthiotransferase RimO n=1 Tax=Catenibacillus scindens TaxID=673271 RepID=A0A7W8HAT8_9FIRM|nr:30S ribosomal protein S12 methylthiotransferase RimO [Catenibacillus scindens]MBB5265081.1 ribosomal protein S12 methylthiotransferase [Catenibacillus scindens]